MPDLVQDARDGQKPGFRKNCNAAFNTAKNPVSLVFIRPDWRSKIAL